MRVQISNEVDFIGTFGTVNLLVHCEINVIFVSIVIFENEFEDNLLRVLKFSFGNKQFFRKIKFYLEFTLSKKSNFNLTLGILLVTMLSRLLRKWLLLVLLLGM